MSDRVEEVVLEEAQRAIGIQVASLDELRSRTGLLLAASSVAGSFLGSAAASSNSGSLSCVGGLAILSFAAAIGLCIYILMPRMDAWEFVTSPTALAHDWLDYDRGDAFLMQRKLAERLDVAYDRNKTRLDRLFVVFQYAAFAVGAEVILGAVQLATNN